jgi:hypothetical protein
VKLENLNLPGSARPLPFVTTPELPGDHTKPFQRRNIFLLTITFVTKYFFRVPAHQYFQVSSYRRKAFWEPFQPKALFGAKQN